MSNCYVNIMINGWHFQILRYPFLKPSIQYNNYHKSSGWPDGKFKIYQVSFR